MWNLIWPIVLIVTSNTLYNICAKSTPANANSFLSLMVTYLSAAGLSALFFLLGPHDTPLGAELRQLNWTAPVLGGVIVALEFGYICAYRAGWKVTLCSITGNLCLACVLLLVGVLLYRETLTLRQVAGILVCGVGLLLIHTS